MMTPESGVAHPPRVGLRIARTRSIMALLSALFVRILQQGEMAGGRESLGITMYLNQNPESNPTASVGAPAANTMPRSAWYHTTLLVGALLIGCLGCGTFYYKQFVFGGSPRHPNYELEISGVFCYLQVNANPVDKRSYEDSTYQVRLSLMRAPSDVCSDEWQQFFETVALEQLALQIGDSVVFSTAPKRPDSSWRPCSVNWYFPSVMIPESVDSLRALLALSYDMDGTLQRFDTALVLTRIAGKEKEMISF